MNHRTKRLVVTILGVVLILVMIFLGVYVCLLTPHAEPLTPLVGVAGGGFLSIYVGARRDGML